MLFGDFGVVHILSVENYAKLWYNFVDIYASREIYIR